MDGENKGKPYCLMDDLGGKPTIFGNTHFYVPINPTAKLRVPKMKIFRLPVKHP